MTLIYSFDLDSTLADTVHRRHLILEDRSQMTDQDWVAYSQACTGDSDGPAAPLIRAIIEQQALAPAAKHVNSGHPQFREYMPVDFIVVSRRDNSARELTEAWLNARGWAPRRLIMLKDEFPGSDQRKHALWKLNAINAYEAETGDRVVLHIDDYHEVTQTMLLYGIPAITVRGDEEGEYATIGHAKEIAAS